MSAESPIDVRDMRIVHMTYRTAFDQAADLVRRNPTPSSERVAFLSEHIESVIVESLHHHHEAEDTLMFPLLFERLPERTALFDHMEEQHRDISAALDSVNSACSLWRAQPTQQSGNALADAIDSLVRVLVPHLDEEEASVVPLAAVTLSEKEWHAVGDRARAAIPRNKLPIAFGMLLEPLNDDDRRFMESHLPFFVRLLSGPLLKRPWEKYRTELLTGT